MTSATLTCTTVKQEFPAGTVDTPFTFIVTGTLADGTPFSASSTDSIATATFDLAPGTYQGTVTKNGVSSLPSASLTITAPTTVTLEVPDPAAAATLV